MLKSKDLWANKITDEVCTRVMIIYIGLIFLYTV